MTMIKSKENIFKTIILMTGCYNLVSCEGQEKDSYLENFRNDSLLREFKLSQNLVICQLMNALGSTLNSFDLHKKNEKWKNDVEKRSYHNGYGSPSSYTAFDPISVLASLAFLAFLLQSFASFFDRSRSILPTIISGRSESVENDETRGITKRVLSAFDEYNDLDN